MISDDEESALVTIIDGGSAGCGPSAFGGSRHLDGRTDYDGSWT